MKGKAMKTAPPKNDPLEESPVVWFVMLERARMDRDFQRAAEAQRQLARLGVQVKYTRAGVSRGN